MSLIINPIDLSPSGWYYGHGGLGNDGDLVGTWADQSGNNRTLAQATEAAKPRVFRHGKGGQRYVYFDGTDDYLQSYVNLSAYLGTDGIGTVFAVFAHPDTADDGAYRVLWSVNVSGNHGAVMAYDLTGGTALMACKFETAGGAYALTRAEKPFLGRVDARTAGGTRMVNGTHIGLWQHVTAGSLHKAAAGIDNLDDAALKISDGYAGADNQLAYPVNVGYSQLPGYFEGAIFELIFYPTVLTQAQRRGIQLYLASKYCIEYYSGLDAGEAASVSVKVEACLPCTDILHDATLDLGKDYYQAAGPIIPPTMWLKADALALNDGDRVQTWTDSSGANHPVEQAVLAIRPTFKTNIVNGKPAVLFNGTDQFMSGSTSLSTLLAKDGSGTVFVVAKVTSGVNAYNPLWAGGLTATPPRLSVDSVAGDAKLHAVNYDGTEDTAEKAATWNAFHVAMWGHDAGSVFFGTKVLANWDGGKYGDTVTTDTGATQNLSAVFCVGGQTLLSQYLAGYVAEVLVYDYVMSQPQMLHVLSYLTNKYGITYPYAEPHQKAWVDVTSDVIRRESIELTYGIRGSGFNDRVAEIGALSLAMRNSADNSASTVGLYSPESASKREGWQLSAPIRVALTYYGITYYKWRGRVTDVRVEPGKENYAARVLGQDYMDDINRMLMPRLNIEYDKKANDIMDKVMLYVPALPPNWLFDAGTVTFPFVYDSIEDDRSPVLAEIGRAVASELGYLYVRGDACLGSELILENRDHRKTVTNVTWTVPKTTELNAVYSIDDIVNRCTVRVYPREVKTSPEVIFTLGEKLQIQATEPTIVWICPYRGNASGRAKRVGAKDVITPVATTDYKFTQNEDGSGADYTTQLDVTITKGGSSAEVAVYNNGPNAGYLSFFQLRGTALYTYEQITVDVKNTTSIAAYGEQTESVEMPYVCDPRDGDAAADKIIARYKDPHTWVKSLSFVVADSETAMAALTREIGDRVAISEDTTGLTNAVYHIQAITLKIDEGQIFVTWVLTPGES